jgi:hypothetical protein
MDVHGIGAQHNTPYRRASTRRSGARDLAWELEGDARPEEQWPVARFVGQRESVENSVRERDDDVERQALARPQRNAGLVGNPREISAAGRCGDPDVLAADVKRRAAVQREGRRLPVQEGLNEPGVLGLPALSDDDIGSRGDRPLPTEEDRTGERSNRRLRARDSEQRQQRGEEDKQPGCQ